MSTKGTQSLSAKFEILHEACAAQHAELVTRAGENLAALEQDGREWYMLGTVFMLLARLCGAQP